MYSTARYKEIQTETASRERILIMLLDAALKNIRLGIAALEEKRADAHTFLSKASDIIVELHATLDRPRAPELCDRLADIYQFSSLRLIKATTTKDATFAREAERAMVPIVEGFKEAVAIAAQQQGGNGGGVTT